ncbi:MAG: TlpA disulfide reductase family protein [Methylococcales bacterium]|nr:TlpA disulfide reductase family protein [Methylococcales bacterium]
MKLGKFLAAVFFLLSLNVHADDTLPTFSFPDTEEKMHNISEWSGKTRVINFWATWCHPCLKEIPEFMQLQTKFTAKNVQFIGVAIDELPAVTSFKETAKMNYPVLVASEWEGFNLSQQLGNSANTVPYTVVVNPAGQIIYRHAGAVKKEDLLQAIQLKPATQ